MAITTTTISKPVGWAATDVILQLEQAFTWLGFNGSTQTGIVTGISDYSGGGTVSGSYEYGDVFPVTTSGIGTGASFHVTRDSTITTIYVNRPGVGYTNGEYVTLSANDIGGSGNGAVAIGITVCVDGGASPVGYGTTTTFYDKDVTAGSSNPWGVLRHQIQSNKKFGSTYRAFQVSGNSLYFSIGSSFHPSNTTNTSNKGNYFANRYAGNIGFDMLNSMFSSGFSANSVNGDNAPAYITYSSSSSYQLDLNIFRSSIDPKFAVLSFRHPTLSSTTLSGNTYATFFVHNYTSSLWDLNELFLGGFTSIEPEAVNTSNPSINFRTYVAKSANSYTTLITRSAEYGFLNSSSNGYKSARYESNAYRNNGYSSNFASYYRKNTDTTGGYNNTETLSSTTNFNAVIKGLPINPYFIPCPYYIPDDFVLIDFDYASPSANIQQGDTITISGSEVYTVISGSYNQTTRTRGILFCARTV